MSADRRARYGASHWTLIHSTGGDDELFTRALGIPDTVTNLTGGGGTHYLFQHPGHSIPNKVELFPGIDVRGDGGQIVLPPSLHESGRRYAWEVSFRPESTPLAPCPQWLIAALSGAARPQGAAPAISGRIVAKGPGSPGRRPALVSLAGSMRRRGMTAAEIEAALLVVNADRCIPPLPDVEITKIAKSIAKYEAAVLATPLRPSWRNAKYAPVRPLDELLAGEPNP